MKKYIAWLTSFFSESELESYYSKRNGRLTVSYENGVQVLNTDLANYSFGSLSRLFRKIFSLLGPSLKDRKSVLILGAGAGSVIALLHQHGLTEVPVTAVEHDPMVIKIARRHFGMDQWKNVTLVEKDALAFMNENSCLYDLLIIDLFRDLTVPDVFLTTTFFELVSHALTGGGILVFNIITNTPFLKTKHAEMVRFFENTGTVHNIRFMPFNRVLIVTKNQS